MMVGRGAPRESTRFEEAAGREPGRDARRSYEVGRGSGSRSDKVDYEAGARRAAAGEEHGVAGKTPGVPPAGLFSPLLLFSFTEGSSSCNEVPASTLGGGGDRGDALSAYESVPQARAPSLPPRRAQARGGKGRARCPQALMRRAAMRLVLLMGPLLALVVAFPRPPSGDQDDTPQIIPSDIGTTFVYRVDGTAEAPSYGTIRLGMQVELTAVDEDAEGVRLMRASFPAKASMTDRNGLRRSLHKPHDVDVYDFYYRQGASGAILEVIHHPNEHWEALYMKREIASAMQLVELTANARRMRRRMSQSSSRSSSDAMGWSTHERDVGGIAEAAYTLDVGPDGSVLQKQVVYLEDEEHSFVRRETNTTAKYAIASRTESLILSAGPVCSHGLFTLVWTGSSPTEPSRSSTF